MLKFKWGIYIENYRSIVLFEFLAYTLKNVQFSETTLFFRFKNRVFVHRDWCSVFLIHSGSQYCFIHATARDSSAFNNGSSTNHLPHQPINLNSALREYFFGFAGFSQRNSSVSFNNINQTISVTETGCLLFGD
jgi:hypothetical protein